MGEHGRVVFGRELENAKDLLAGRSWVVIHRHADTERTLRQALPQLLLQRTEFARGKRLVPCVLCLDSKGGTRVLIEATGVHQASHLLRPLHVAVHCSPAHTAVANRGAEVQQRLACPRPQPRTHECLA